MPPCYVTMCPSLVSNSPLCPEMCLSLTHHMSIQAMEIWYYVGSSTVCTMCMHYADSMGKEKKERTGFFA